LWTEEEEFDYAGKFFNIEKAFIGRSRCSFRNPPIMNAASPALGARFAAKHADMAFIAFYEENLADAKRSWRNASHWREDFSREFQNWTSCASFAARREGGQGIRALLTSTKKAFSARSETIIGRAGSQGPEPVAGSIRAQKGGWPRWVAILSSYPSRSSRS